MNLQDDEIIRKQNIGTAGDLIVIGFLHVNPYDPIIVS